MYIITEDHTILNQQNLSYYIKNKLTNNIILLMSATAAVEFFIL